MNEIVFSNLNAFKEAKIKPSANPVTRPGFGTNLDWTQYTIESHIPLAKKAYLTDGIVRSAIDKFIDSIGKITISGNPKIVQYVHKRLNLISLNSSSPWEILLMEAWQEYWKVGSVGLLKIRGGTEGVRALYQNKPYLISALYPVDMEDLNPKTKDGVSYWTSKETLTLFTKSHPRYQVKNTLLQLNDVGDEKALIPNLDILVLAYKRPINKLLGIGVSFTAINDVRQLRRLEADTMIMISKNLHPLIHHKILGPGYGSNLNTEMHNAEAKWRTMPPDGVYVTAANHELHMYGGESHALRVADYLKFFSTRSISSMGTTPFDLGFEKGTVADSDATFRNRKVKIDSAKKQFEIILNTYLLWELAWEGGFDPYSKESDRVYIHLGEIDDQIIRVKENHIADLYTKGVLDWDEARAEISSATKKSPDLKKMFINLGGSEDLAPSTAKEGLELAFIPTERQEIFPSLQIRSEITGIDLTQYKENFLEQFDSMTEDLIGWELAYTDLIKKYETDQTN